ncbi:MAG: endopeptidase La, partial [Candidatus Hydrogenedentes bacterium]|nr:endopeptidase La [Candidatus Hydrogenedentota bacterium]
GYTTHEKLEIAKKYLVPRQLERHGITLKQLRITASALRAIIASYTREAGVRNLEREIANVCRGVARHIAEGRGKATRIEPGDLKKYLGNPRFEYEVAERTSVAGVATGLAWTATGGDMLFVEATRMPGKGNLVLTGQLGDVMKESATAVLSYVRSNAEALGMAPEIFQHSDIHIHVPQGAVPKDGPSAGVTILAAVASLLLGKKIKSGLAMTGEITLRGQVLPVGGVKEKVLAASRAGIKHVILPARNELDLEDVPDTVRNKMRFYPVQRMDEVVDIGLGISSNGAGAGGMGRTENKRK